MVVSKAAHRRRRRVALFALATTATIAGAALLVACFGELPPLLAEGPDDASPGDEVPTVDATPDASPSFDAAPTDAAADTGAPPDAADADAASAYAAAVLVDKPLAYWRFDEAAGSLVAHDSSGSQHTLTFSGSGVELGTPGALRSDSDTAVGLNPKGALPSYASGGSILAFGGTAPFTLELWARADTTSSDYLELLGRTDLAQPPKVGYVLTVRPGQDCVLFQRFIEGGAGVIDSCSGPTSGYLVAGGPWEYLVLTYTGSELLFYVNATAPGVSTSTAPAVDGGLGPFLVGGNDGNFSGSIDELAVYGYALDAGRIAAHYAASGNP